MPWKGTGRRRWLDTGKCTCSPVENGPPRAHNTAAPLAAQQQPRTSTPTNHLPTALDPTTHAHPPAKSPAQRIHAPRRRVRHHRVRPSNMCASTRPPSTRQPCDGLASCKEALGAACVKSRMQTHTLSRSEGAGATGRIGPVHSKCHRRGAANPRLRALLLPHTARVQTEPCGNAGDVTGAHQWKRAPTRSALRPFRSGHTSTPPHARPPPPPSPVLASTRPQPRPARIGTMPPSNVVAARRSSHRNSMDPLESSAALNE